MRSSSEAEDNSAGLPTMAEVETQNSAFLAPAAEGNRVKDLEEAFWQVIPDSDSICYVLPWDWWLQWCSYTGFRVQGRKHATVQDYEDDSQRGSRPGAIDNTKLLKACTPSGASDVTDGLQEGVNFCFRAPGTWELFKQLYPGSGPEICRPICADGRPEMYALQIHVHRSSDLAGRPVTLHISKYATVADFKGAACQKFGLEEVDVRTFDYYQRKKYSVESLEGKLDETLDQANIMENQDMLLEEKVDGKFPEPERSAPSAPLFGSTTHYTLGRGFGLTSEDVISSDVSARPGTAGLGNLGNTCFMNSSVQCLAHCVPLMRVFLQNAYKEDINRDNPLGNEGQLAEAFGSLMQKLWQGGVSSVSPKRFKQQVASFAPHFAGYQQHDSQELLAFLLDGLHEDLNRIKNKPYIEESDCDGRSDEEIAAEAWRNYKARNDSFIVDHFQGLYKSTLVCPDCSFHSVKMDPFLFLSLPLPAAKMRSIEVTVVTMDGSAPPTQYALEVLKLGNIGDLYKALAKVCAIEEAAPEKVLLLVEIYNGRIHQKFTDLKEPLADGIRGNITLLAYCYPSPELGPESGGKEMHVFQRRARKRPSFYSYNSDPYEVFAAPLLLWLPEERIRADSGDEYSSADKLFDPEGPLSAAVETALRPFKRQRLLTEDSSVVMGSAFVHKGSQLAAKPAEDESEDLYGDDTATASQAPTAANADDNMAGPLDDPLQTVCGRQHPTGMHPSDRELSESDETAAEEPLVGLPGKAPGLPRSTRKGGIRKFGLMEMAAINSITPQLTPQSSPVTSPLGTPRADSEKSTSFHSSLEPFDMFAMQRPDLDELSEPSTAAPDAHGSEPSASTAAASTQGLPYRIQPATPSGSPVSSGQLSMDDGQLYFAIDWAADAGTQYEPERIEQPQLHCSVGEAKARQAAGPKPNTLDECIDVFLEGERLLDTESWYCKRCKKLVQADKKLDLWSLPEVLVFHLKRFSYSTRFRDKIDALVKFPLEGLNVSHAALREQEIQPVYDLFAVSNHFGGLGGGHYTAYCKLNEDGKWYSFDDSHAHPISPESVQTQAAYVLFYRRRREAQADAGKSVDQLFASAPGLPGLPKENGRSSDELPAASDGRNSSDAAEPMSRADSPELQASDSDGIPNGPAMGAATAGGRCATEDIQEAPANGLLQDMEWQCQGM